MACLSPESAKVRRSRRKPSPAERLVSQGQEIEYPRRRRDRHAARAKSDVGRLRRAIAKYSEAIELDPHLVEAYIQRASTAPKNSYDACVERG
jgi:hypothetical protein